MQWIDAKERLPENNAKDAIGNAKRFVVLYYNDHIEIATFQNNTWRTVSDKFSEPYEDIEKLYWPDYWADIELLRQ